MSKYIHYYFSALSTKWWRIRTGTYIQATAQKNSGRQTTTQTKSGRQTTTQKKQWSTNHYTEKQL
jgi:hypothetical protein